MLEQMWTHSSAMKEEFQLLRRPRAKLNARDLDDLAAFARKGRTDLIPGEPFTLPQSPDGKLAFEQNCGSCHSGPAP